MQINNTEDSFLSKKCFTAPIVLHSNFKKRFYILRVKCKMYISDLRCFISLFKSFSWFILKSLDTFTTGNYLSMFNDLLVLPALDFPLLLKNLLCNTIHFPSPRSTHMLCISNISIEKRRHIWQAVLGSNLFGIVLFLQRHAYFFSYMQLYIYNLIHVPGNIVLYSTRKQIIYNLYIQTHT